MIARMDRVEVVFLRSEIERMIAFLHQQGVMHVEDVPLAMEDFPGYLHRIHLPQPRKEELQALQQWQRMLQETLPLLSPAPAPGDIAGAARQLSSRGEDVSAWGRSLQKSHRVLRMYARRRLNILENSEVLRHYRRVLSHVAPIMEERNALLGVNAKAVLVPSSNTTLLDELEKQVIQDVGPECDVVRRAMDRTNTVAVILHPAGRGDAIRALLDSKGVVPLEVPDRELTKISVSDAIARIDAKLEAFGHDLARIAAESRAFSLEHGATLHALDRAIRDQLSQLEIVHSFAESEMIAVVHGWVPTERYVELEQALADTFGGKAMAGRLPQAGVDAKRVPTLLRNHPIFKPFQLILGMFDPPKYGTIDPTWIVAVSFVLFYGFILGDAGYGLLIIGIATWAKRKWGWNDMLRDGATIAQWMGVSACAWGIFFGEFLGDLPQIYFGIPAPFHRMHQPLLLLGLAIGYGLVHVPLSLMIAIREGYRHHHREHAEEKLGMLLGLFAVLSAVAGILGYFPGGMSASLIAAAVLFIVGLYFLVRSMGAMAPMGVMEIIGLTSNILSYGRLMALGLASVVLAELANRVLGFDGILFFLVGIPLAGFIHLLNIGIGVFSPTIHSLRLNYVEFLPKFYEPEGRNYKPFRKELTW